MEKWLDDAEDILNQHKYVWDNSVATVPPAAESEDRNHERILPLPKVISFDGLNDRGYIVRS